MIGSIIGAGMKIGGAIFGGAKAAQAAKEQQQILSQAKKENQDWYDRRYNEDFTKRADALQTLNYAKQQAENLYKRSAGASAVTGATDEASALQKEAGNKMISEATSSIAAQADDYKQGVENQYLNQKNSFEQQQMQVLREKAGAIQQAVGGVNNAAGGLSSGIGGLFSK